MAFLAVIRDQEGCDYSIGCGIRLFVLPPGITDAAEAEKWLLGQDQDTDVGEEMHFGAFNGHEDEIAKSAVLYNVIGSQNVNLGRIAVMVKATNDAIASGETEKRDRAELTRLQAKYPKAKE